MTPTKALSLALAIIALGAGLRSAYLWYRASRVQIVPMCIEQGRVEPVMPGRANTEWLVAMLETAQKSGKLNRKAAIWTGVAVALSTAATLAGAI